jgi:ATP-dependent Lhr-like helicase
VGESGSGGGSAARPSIWPHVTERLVDLIAEHQSTIVFVNSRQVAERLATRINDLWETRERAEPSETANVDGDDEPEAYEPPDVRRLRLPASYIGAANVAAGSATVAMAHHGSMSHERRHIIEEDLKGGRLRAVVATSSLELGIDMGAVDLVIQVEAPGTVASGLQRIGRAGHQVGAVSEGVFFPKYLGDLVAMTVVVERMRAGAIETTTILQNPLDVLSQQIVAMVAMEPWLVDALYATLQRAAPFAHLTRPILDSVLDLLSGRYPGDEFAELRPRLDWDRAAGRLTARRGAQRLAVTSGGTIPDRGLYGVFLAEGPASGRRVGELDEEMVFESRVGDAITLGSSTWLITGITNDQVLVAPAPGSPGRLPFWKGDGLGRAAELGQAIGAFVRTVGQDPAAAQERLAGLGLDEWATDNLLTYLADQRSATGAVPDDETVVVESFRDELGDWRIVVCCPLGGRVNTPWSLLIAASLRQAYGVDVQAMATDDGIVFRLPDTAVGWDADAPAAWARDGLTEHLLAAPDAVEDLVRAELANSSHFAVRFREAAARALLLPRRQPGRRQPLWQLRNRAAQLLQVAARYPEFPIMLEATRECLRDDFDLAALAELMARIARRQVRVVEVTTPQPSPFARTVLFNYVGLFMYESDVPLAELRAAALTVDPTLLAELLGSGAGLDPADLLDPAVLTMVESELQSLTPTRQARDGEDLHDLIRRLGPISPAALVARTRPEVGDQVETWLADLVATGQVEALSSGSPAHIDRPNSAVGPASSGGQLWVAATDADLLASALGPTGSSGDRADEASRAARSTLLRRYARTHAPFTVDEVAAWLGLAPAGLRDELERLTADQR